MPLTLHQLIEKFRSDPDSPFAELGHEVRIRNGRLLARIDREHGRLAVRDIHSRTLMSWHKAWLDGDKVAMAHVLVSQLRQLFRFGAAFLHDRECYRLADALIGMRFEKPSRRFRTMTRDQAVAHRKHARKRGWPFMALAQAFQFDLKLSQRDAIGEWVPHSDPNSSDTFMSHRNLKWINGLRWEAIDENLILRHVSRRGKNIVADLRTAPMIMEELAWLFEVPPEQLTRVHLPPSGPVILCEINGWPYLTTEFRRKWRKVAKVAGLPNDLQNSDSRQTAG